MSQPLYRRPEQGAGILQIGMAFPSQNIKIQITAGGTRRVSGIIQKNPAPFPHGFPINQDVDQGRAEFQHFSRIKRPLIPFQEYRVQHFPGIRKGIQEKLPFVTAILFCGNIARQHLLIGARQIPPEPDRSNPVLGLRQVFAFCAGFQGNASPAGLTFGIDRSAVQPGRTAGGINNVGAAKYHISVIGVFRMIPVQGQQPHGVAFAPVGQYGNRLISVKNPYLFLQYLLLQALCHHSGSQGAGGCGPLPRIVVGLITHVFPKAVMGKGNPCFHQMVEAPH